MSLLARREHSSAELTAKLRTKDYPADDISLIIDRLIKENYQNDGRFAEEFVRMRVNQGKGRALIKQQLKQKGIDTFDFSKFDFFALAQKVRVQKYGTKSPENYQQKAKQMRFLQSRGFDLDAINAAFN